MTPSPPLALRFLPVAILAFAFVISIGRVEGQTATQLALGIRNFEFSNRATLTAVPKFLSQTGLYQNIGSKATRAISDTSVTAFQVNSALWSDGSHKERFISLLPGTKVVPNDTAKFTFPDGAVLIKNFLIDTVYGDNTGNSRIFVETRFLVHQAGPSGTSWSGLSYRWRRDQTDAELVSPDTGLNDTHNLILNGNRVGKRWRYPSSGDCTQCHKGNETTNRGSLGFITPQLNRVINGTNQLQNLFARGILTANPVAGKPNAHRWYAPTDTSATLEQRVRSYFASNCSHCHGNNVVRSEAKQNFDYFSANKRITFTPDSQTGEDSTGAWVGMPSVSGGDQSWLVLPGYPDSSLILGKMMHRNDDDPREDAAQMPPIATSQPDSAAVSMIEKWVCSLKAGTPCGKIPWQADETFWAEEAVSIRPQGNGKGLAFQSFMRRGQLWVPSTLAALGVQLWDYRGRKVALVQDGEGRFRITRILGPGIYVLVAGRHRQVLNYTP